MKKLPQKFDFHTQNQKRIIYHAELIDTRVHVAWTSPTKGAATTSYDASVVSMALRDKHWIIVDYSTNENALGLLSEEE